MSLLLQLLQEITNEERRVGETQCFIGHEFHNKDLRVKLERALQKMGLHAYFADKEVTGEFILTKVCRKILITRASIVDLTTANPNVYFELGVAIGLNKPVFIVLKHGASVPPLLESFVKLRFTHYAKLEEDLALQVPGWLEQSIEHHLLYNTHCQFVNVLCPDRQRIIPQRHYLVIDQIEGIDELGQPAITYDSDLHAELSSALDRFLFTPEFLGEVPLRDTFRVCDYCRALRNSSFALCHLSQSTSPNVYLLLGLVIGLNIPSLLIVHEEHDKNGRLLLEIPSMLRGLDAFYYKHSVDIGERLADEVEGFLHRQKSKPTPGRVLVFPDLIRRSTEESKALEEAQPKIVSSSRRVLIVDDDTNWQDVLKGLITQALEKHSLTAEVDTVASVEKALELLSRNVFNLIILEASLNHLDPDDRTGLDFIRQAREKGVESPIVIATSYISVATVREAFQQWRVFDVVNKASLDTQAFSDVITNALGIDVKESDISSTTLDKIRQQIAGLTDLNSKLDLLLNTLARLIGADVVSLYQYDQEQDQFRLPGFFVGSFQSSPSVPPNRDSIAYRILQAPESYFSEDAENDSLVTSSFSRREQIRSFAGLPLLVGDGVVGILFINFRTLHPFEPSERNLLVEIARIAANAIRDARDNERKTEVQASLSAARSLTDSAELVQLIVQNARQVAQLGDVASVHELLALVQSITDTPQQAKAMIAIVDALVQMHEIDSLRRIVEIALTITDANAQREVLWAASRAYEKLDESEKARQVEALIQSNVTDNWARLADQLQDRGVFPPLVAEEGIQAVAVNSLIRERIQALWTSERYKPVEVELFLKLEDSATVRASPEWLRRVLDILVANAIDATLGMPQRKIVITSRLVNNEAEISITDTGRGIPSEIHDLLFREPISKAQGEKGSGIGLLLAKIIVETYEGSMRLAATGPNGTTLSFSLPLERIISANEPRQVHEPIHNPFTFGGPIQRELFFGRQKELQTVLAAIDRGQNISIIGSRGLGKTSLLHMIVERLQMRGDFICISVDLQMFSSEKEFYQFLGSEFEKVGVRNPNGENQEWSALAIREACQRETQRRKIVLLLDEIEVAAHGTSQDRFSRQFFDALRSFGNSGLFTIVTASAKGLFELDVGSRNVSPFANIFSVIQLEPFTRDVAERLATLNGTIDFSTEEIDFIMSMTAGHPYFIKMLCTLLIDAKNANMGRVDLEVIRAEFLKQSKPFRDSLDAK